MDNGNHDSDEKAVSDRKLEANRQNAAKSTGPKTAEGKALSRWNAVKHGLLSRKLLFQEGVAEGSREEFKNFLESLSLDLEPVGALEELLVEKIAVEYWRLQFAIQHETGAIRKGSAFHNAVTISVNNPDAYGLDDLDKLVRYGGAINRQLFQAINQLERAQRLRNGEAVPAPINVEVAG